MKPKAASARERTEVRDQADSKGATQGFALAGERLARKRIYKKFHGYLNHNLLNRMMTHSLGYTEGETRHLPFLMTFLRKPVNNGG